MKKNIKLGNDILTDGAALAELLEDRNFPEGTKIRGTKYGTLVREPGKIPYILNLVPKDLG